MAKRQMKGKIGKWKTGKPTILFRFWKTGIEATQKVAKLKNGKRSLEMAKMENRPNVVKKYRTLEALRGWAMSLTDIVHLAWQCSGASHREVHKPPQFVQHRVLLVLIVVKQQRLT